LSSRAARASDPVIMTARTTSIWRRVNIERPLCSAPSRSSCRCTALKSNRIFPSADSELGRSSTNLDIHSIASRWRTAILFASCPKPIRLRCGFASHHRSVHGRGGAIPGIKAIEIGDRPLQSRVIKGGPLRRVCWRRPLFGPAPNDVKAGPQRLGKRPSKSTTPCYASQPKW